MISSQSVVINYLLEPYALDGGIAESDDKILQFTQPSSMTLMKHNEALWNKAPAVTSSTMHGYVLVVMF